MDPTAMMNPMGGHFGPGMVSGMPPGGFASGSMPHMPPGGFGLAIEKTFPAVRLRGLPFNAAEFDVLEFFSGLEAIDTLIVRRDGRTTGEAYVLFANAQYMDFGLAKNRAPMGRRYIEVFRAKKQEYYGAVANAVREATSGFHGERNLNDASVAGNGNGNINGYAIYGDAVGGVSRNGAPAVVQLNGAPPLPMGGPPGVGVIANRNANQTPQQEHTGVLKLRGLPFSATKDDIVSFFGAAGPDGVDITPLVHDSIHIVTSLDGRPSGVAFVELASKEEAQTAMQRDRQSMGTRYVELFASSREEATRAATSGR